MSAGVKETKVYSAVDALNKSILGTIVKDTVEALARFVVAGERVYEVEYKKRTLFMLSEAIDSRRKEGLSS